ncbi:MAG: ABC transporter transmembrane domain-containing protein, partial [Propionicimonas sp.]
MSAPPNTQAKTPIKANERPKYAPPQRSGGPMGHGTGTGEKAVSFGPSLRRLLGHLRPERMLIVGVMAMVVVATGLMAIGPAILGQATNLIFDAHVVNQTPIDFTAVGEVLLIALVAYVIAGAFSWGSGWIINGIVQRSVYRMRAEVSDKIARLPLKYFDSQPRGELLSRVTNDVDNVSQSLQQTLSQVLTNIFMLLGVLVMMFVL